MSAHLHNVHIHRYVGRERDTHTHTHTHTNVCTYIFIPVRTWAHTHTHHNTPHPTPHRTVLPSDRYRLKEVSMKSSVVCRMRRAFIAWPHALTRTVVLSLHWRKPLKADVCQADKQQLCLRWQQSRSRLYLFLTLKADICDVDKQQQCLRGQQPWPRCIFS